MNNNDLPEDVGRLLDYENMDVYHVILDFIVYVEKVLAPVPKGAADMIDQLRRSSSSIALNLAQGAGRTGSADKARFYTIAIGSATESSMALDVLHARGHLSFQDLANGKILVRRIVAMMVALAKSVGGRVRK